LKFKFEFNRYKTMDMESEMMHEEGMEMDQYDETGMDQSPD
jgi:hypothetical protein